MRKSQSHNCGGTGRGFGDCWAGCRCWDDDDVAEPAFEPPLSSGLSKYWVIGSKLVWSVGVSVCDTWPGEAWAELNKRPLLPTPTPDVALILLPAGIVGAAFMMAPSLGQPIVKRTCKPDSLIKLTTSPCDMPAISMRFTAIIRSPTLSSPQRSAGLPGMSLPSFKIKIKKGNIKMENIKKFY